MIINQINDYYKTIKNVIFTKLFEIINASSNQDVG